MKKVLAGLLLSASTVAGYAAPVSVEISYLGAWRICDDCELGIRLDPSARMDISFTGEDLNNDQVITYDEVSKLIASGQDFSSPSPPQEGYSIYAFEYHSNSDFNIGLYHYKDLLNGDFVLFGNVYATANEAAWTIDRDSPWGPWGNYFTDRFVTTISISSVPEPSAIAMSAIGLCLIGFMARRRQRAASH